MKSQSREPTHNAGQVWQHAPVVVVGAVSGVVHMVGKHHTSLQKVLGVPPCSPDAPLTKSSTLMSGLTQYGQQWPGYNVSVNPAGHDRAPHVITSHGSLIPCCFCCFFTRTTIRVFMFRSKA